MYHTNDYRELATSTTTPTSRLLHTTVKFAQQLQCNYGNEQQPLRFTSSQLLVSANPTDIYDQRGLVCSSAAAAPQFVGKWSNLHVPRIPIAHSTIHLIMLQQFGRFVLLKKNQRVSLLSLSNTVP